MTDTTKYVAEALKELELVKTEGGLIGWHDSNMNTIEYATQLTVAQVNRLEDAYQRKLAQFMPAGLAG